ncbi:MAG: hypothetical protein M1833_003259 [Piccolia ochrophora]|nr:MAG: hypothetical protein M1833_003259 [Piccolia ochrophora]
MYSADAEVFIRITQSYGDGWLLEKLLPLAKKHASNARFSITFANRLFEAGQDEKISKEVAVAVFREFVPHLVELLELPNPHPAGDERDDKPGYCTFRRPRQKSQRSVLSGKEIATFVAHCHAASLHTQIDQVYGRLLQQAKKMLRSVFIDLILPLLTELPKVLRSNGTSVSSEPHSDFCRHMLTSYLTRVVGQEPTPPTDWRREKRGCGCEMCDILDEFLIDPAKQSAEFHRVLGKEYHLLDRLMRGSDRAFNFDGNAAMPSWKIIKRPFPMEYDHILWELRCKQAQSELKRFDQKDLKAMLGDRYDETLELRCSKGMIELWYTTFRRCLIC